MRPHSVETPRKGSHTPETAPKPLDTDKHAPLPFQQALRQRFGDSLLARLYVCILVYVYGLHAYPDASPGYFEIQKNSSVTTMTRA